MNIRMLALAVLTLVSAALAQTPDLHTTVPLVYPPPGDARRARLDQVFIDARTLPRHGLIFGSSLYTVDGQGQARLTNLNAAMQSAYGSSPSTPWVPMRNKFGGVPNAQFGMSTFCGFQNGLFPSGGTSTVGGQGLVPGLDTTYVAPSFTPAAITNDSDDNGSSDATGIAITNGFQFEPDNGYGAPNAYSHPQRRFGTANRIFEWIGWSRGQASSMVEASTIMSWEVRKQGATLPVTYFAGSSVQNIASVNIPTPNGFDPNSATHQAARLWLPATNGATATEVVHDASNPYKVGILRATGAAGPAGYIAAGVRWRVKDAHGITFTGVAEGGYNIGSVLASHANCGPTLKAMGADIIVIALHTNSAFTVNYDARNDASPSTSFYHLALALVDWTRGHFPGVPILFLTDQYRAGGTAGQQEQYSRMVGAMKQICDARNDVGLINLLLAMESEGFNSESVELTGLTFRNQWATSTAYVVGDYVSLDGIDGIEYARCILNHTSAASDKPRSGVNHIFYWRAVRRGYDPGANLTTAPTDPVHLSELGDQRVMDVAARLMLFPMATGNTIDLRGPRFTSPGR